MNFNGVSANEYAWRRNENGATQQGNNNPDLPFIDYNDNTTQTGNGVMDLWSKRSINQLISASSQFSTKIVGLGNNPSIIQKSLFYENIAAANLTSIEIDTNNVNHNGSQLYYRLMRYE